MSTTSTDERAAGRAEERTRFAAIINAEGVVGNSARLHSALNLACSSPEMSADAVVGFVTANVPEGKTPGQALAEREHPANALDFRSTPPSTAAGDADRFKAGWSRAAERVNAQRGLGSDKSA